MAFLKEKKRYKVYVDDNSHYQDNSQRYLKGSYTDCEAAVNASKQIVDDFLAKAYGKDKTEDQLWSNYTNWGEEPFIVAIEGEKDCSFSAWDYAKERIKAILDKANK